MTNKLILHFLSVLQSLNQRPGQPINMPGMQNKMQGMGMMPAQTGGPMNHMNQIQTMQNNSMLTQINQIGPGNIPQMNQMVQGQMGQLASGQMQQNMQVPFICFYKNKKSSFSNKRKRKTNETV